MMRRSVPLCVAVACAVLMNLPARSDPPATLGDFTLPDSEGRIVKSSDFKSCKAVVLYFMGAECQASNRYIEDMDAIASEYNAKSVAVLGVNSNFNEQATAGPLAREHGAAFTLLLDGDHALADRLAVETTPTAILLDASGKIRYRGRVDDAPMGGVATRKDLREALDSVLAGKDVEVPVTEARGCAVRRNKPAASGPVTWSKDVAPIVFANCVQCHRSGQIGPMPLTDFSHASAFGPEIKAAVTSKRMPPWKPVAGCEFVGKRGQTDGQIATIVSWIDGGTPEGDPKDEPEAPKFSEEWALGEPDMVLEPEEDFKVRQGPDLYWHFVLHPKIDEDKWVTAVEIQPGNRRIVHHVLAYLDTTGTADRLDAAEPKLGYKGSGAWPGFFPIGEMGGWTPGQTPKALPAGVARRLDKGAALVLQVHYNNPSGGTLTDRTRIGLYFAKTPPRQRLVQARIFNPNFRLPAGEASTPVEAKWTFHSDITVIGVMPHAHLLCKTFEMIATTPKGKEIVLCRIDDWDFKWQDTYLLQEPLHLPSGTEVRVRATYDNSANNARNPHKPPQTVGWGERTSDEMLLGYVNFVKDHEDLTKKKKNGDEEEK